MQSLIVASVLVLMLTVQQGEIYLKKKKNKNFI